MEFKVYKPDTVAPTTGYSPAVRMGNLLFVAGQVAQDIQGQLVGKDDVRAQTEQVFKNLQAVLEAGGSGLDLVGKITVFTTSLDYRPMIAEARNQFYKEIGHYPASTFVVVSSLASPDWLVEIEAIAAIRE